MLFSAELPVWFICVQENGFLSISEKSTKNHRKSTHPKEPGARSGARGGPGGAQAPCGRPPPPWAAPGGRLGGAHTPWCPTSPRIFTRDAKTPDEKFFLQFSVAEPPPPSVLPREG